MAVWPNNYRTAPGWSPYRHAGAPHFATYKQPAVAQRSPVFGESGAWGLSSSVPDGYGPGGARVLAIRGGGLAAYVGNQFGLVASAELTNGTTLEGTASLSLSGAASLSLQVTLEGGGTISINVSAASLSLVLGLEGAGSFGLVAPAASLSMIVPLEGSASFGLTGAADLRGLLSLVGSWSPFTELSPQSLASAVWSAASASNNAAGSMGELLNGAGGGSSPSTVAEAVWAALRSANADAGSMGEAMVELFELMGLDPTKPLVVTPTSRTVGAIDQTIATAGSTTTVMRDP